MKKSKWLDCQGNEFFPKQKGTPSVVKIEHKNTATLDSARSKKNLKSQFCNYHKARFLTEEISQSFCSRFVGYPAGFTRSQLFTISVSFFCIIFLCYFHFVEVNLRFFTYCNIFS